MLNPNKSDFNNLDIKKNLEFDFKIIRIFDIIIALVALIPFSLIFIITSLAILLEDKSNPIYKDRRLGKNKIPFYLIKFRSMFKNAESMEKQNKEIYEKLRSDQHKVENHPYVTKVGKFIRKTSIDELPQLINVLKGEMSIVGPRALKIDEEEKFRNENPEYAKYLDAHFEVKPGITGFWQVSGRSRIDFKKRIRMEAYFARNFTILNYILILFKTPIAVLRAETH